MIGSPFIGSRWSVLDPAGAVVAPDAIYAGAASRYEKGAKVDLRVFGLPDGSRLVVDAKTATLGPAAVSLGTPAPIAAPAGCGGATGRARKAHPVRAGY